MICSSAPCCQAPSGRTRKKKCQLDFVKRFNELNWHHIMVSSYPIKSTTTADRIRRAFPRLKVLKTVVKRLELDPLILGLSERGGGGSITGPVCWSHRLAVRLITERNKMPPVSSSAYIGRLTNKRWRSEARDSQAQLSPSGPVESPGPARAVLQDDLFRKDVY